MGICEAECPNETSPVEMEEGVNNRIYDKNGKNDEEKEAESPDDTSPDEMEEGLNDRIYDKNKKMMKEKRHNAQMTLPLMRFRKV